MAKINEINLRAVLRVALMLFFASPLFFVLQSSDHPQLPPWSELRPALAASLLQSLLSAVMSLGLGVWGALGLCSLRRPRWILAAEVLFLMPAWLPPLVSLIAVFSFVTRMVDFPFGVAGVVLVHTWMNAGLVAVAVARLARARLAGQIELAWVEGATKWQFIRYGFLPQIKMDLLQLGILIFTLSLTSFAVPLVAGGTQATSLDVLAFQQLQFGHGVDFAAGMAWVEIWILGVLGFVFSHPQADGRREVVNLRFLASRVSLVAFLILGLLVLASTGWMMEQGFWQTMNTPEVWPALKATLGGTLLVSGMVGILIFILFSAVVFVLPHPLFRRLILSFGAPSVLFVGLGLFAWGPMLGPVVGLKLILGLVLLSAAPLYRWLLDGATQSLQEQILVARTLGASWGKIWRRVTWPQLVPDLCLASALASLWAAGDFALSSLIASQNITLAMLVREFLSSYRLELAAFLSLILIVVACVVGSVFLGVRYVFDPKH